MGISGTSKSNITNASILEADTIKTDTIKPGIGALSDVVVVEANLNIKEGVNPGIGVIEFELCDGIIATQGTNTLTLDTNTLKIDGIPATTGVANVLTYDSSTKEVKYQPAGTAPVLSVSGTSGEVNVSPTTGNCVVGLPNIGTAGTFAYPASITTDAKGRVSAITAGSAPTVPTLAQVLIAGNNSGAKDIIMDAGQKIEVETITNTQNITGNPITGGINVKTLSNNNRLELSDITRTANLTAQFGNRTYQHYSDSLNQKAGISFTDPPIGYNRKVEVGIDGGGDYTKLVGIQLPGGDPYDTHLMYETSTGEVYYQQFPIEKTLYPLGDLVVQTVIPNVFYDNETYNIVNNGINPGNVSIPLTPVSNQAYIPFFAKDGTPFPTNVISDNGTPIDPAYPPTPNSGRVKCMITDPYNPKIYVACYASAGQNGTMIYEFNIETNTWTQYALVDGEAYCIILDGNYLYIGGSFNNTTINGGTVACKNIIEIDIPANTANIMPGNGLNGSVNCFEKWNGYIAIGGKFSETALGGTGYLEYFALYDRTNAQFLNINQNSSLTLNDWGFDDQVYSLAVLPQTNTLVIGGQFTSQYANGTTYTYSKICQYQTLTLFNAVGDGSIGGGVVSDMLVDYEGGLLYVAGKFTTSVGDHFVALPINTLNKYIYLGWNGNFFTQGATNALTKDEISGLIWVMNNTDGTVYRFNPNVNTANAYENIGNILSITTPTAVFYSWYDKAVHYAFEGGDLYYRYSCDQRIKMTQQNGDLFIIDGAEYDVLVLPKKGSSITVRGGNSTPSRWYVFGASPGVYGEWATGQITEPGSAYATALLTDSQTGIGNLLFGWNSITGKNINLSSVNSGKITVGQKGLYKMSFSVQLSRSGGGGSHSDVFIWFIVNGLYYQNTNSQFVVGNNDDESAPYNEVFVELNIGDWVGLVMECPTNNIDIPTIPATATQPQIPGAIFKIELVNPTREPFI